MDYVIVSTSVTDDITLADGRHIGKFLGGAGTYALCGIKLWHDDVVLVTGVGKDYYSTYGQWFNSNMIPTNGLLIKDDKSAISNVKYNFDGERVETPSFGLEHYIKQEATPDEIEPFCKTAKGVYIFKDNNDEYWDNVLTLKQKYNFKLMWEINASCAMVEQQESIKKIADIVDVFSINKTEALALFGETDLKDVISHLLLWDIPLVFLRMGSEGSIILCNGQQYKIPSVKDVKVVDVTGGGNSSSAGVLFGFCENLDPITCGVMGSISASVCITQFGTPTKFDNNRRDFAKKLCLDMTKDIKERG